MAYTAYPPLDHTDLNEQAYKVLRDKILRRDLKPGEKISVDEVAQRLGVSRTPVTVALQGLAREGLVEIVPQRGTFVTELTARDVAELFDIRLMIELYAAEFILKNGKADQLLECVKEPMAGMQQAMHEDDYRDYEAFLTSDHNLHLALVKLTGNEHLIRMYDDLNVHIQVARAHYMDSVEKARQAYREHEAIVRAFASDQPAEVRVALCTHICTVKERILEILDGVGGKL